MYISDLHINSDFIIRSSEIEKISYGLTNYNCVYVVGMRGIGKTTLVKAYAQLNPLNFKNVYYFQALRFTFDQSLLTLLEIPPKKEEANLTIIDDIEELSDIERDKILQIVKKGTELGHKVILTGRLATIAHSNYTIRLSGFTQSEAIELIKRRLDNAAYTNQAIEQIAQVLDKLAYNPLLISAATELIKSGRYTYNDILELIKPKLIYQNQLLIEEESPENILPEAPKIITDVKVISSSLTEKVRKNPKLMYTMTSREFEEFVADLFSQKGYDVHLTQQTHDGGKDFYIIDNKEFGKFLYYVECKKYSANRPVGINLVREFYGTVSVDRATAGVLVTSSYFSDEAKLFKEQFKYQISLLEYADLINMMNEEINCQ